MLSPKQLLESHLGRKLTKEEFKIEEKKLFDQWTNALEEDDDKIGGPETENLIVYEDEFTTMILRNKEHIIYTPEEIACLPNESDFFRATQNYKNKRKEIIYLD